MVLIRSMILAGFLLTAGPVHAIGNRTVRLDWKQVDGASAYEVDIYVQDDQGTWQRRGVPEKVVTTTYSSKLPAGTYRLRVRSFDQRGAAGSWSTPRRFSVSPLAIRLRSPPPGSVATRDADGRIRLRWDPLEGVSSYRVTLYNQITNEKTEVTTHKPEARLRLSSKAKYQWEVTALDGNLRTRSGTGSGPDFFHIDEAPRPSGGQ